MNSPVIGYFMFTNNEIACSEFQFKMCLYIEIDLYVSVELFTAWCGLSGLVLPNCIWLAMVIIPKHSVVFLIFGC